MASNESPLLSRPKDEHQRFCAKCHETDSTELTLRRCTRCKFLYYCSRDCQSSHFAHHKNDCKKMAKLRQQAQEGDDDSKFLDLGMMQFVVAYDCFPTIEQGKHLYEQVLDNYITIYEKIRPTPFPVPSGMYPINGSCFMASSTVIAVSSSMISCTMILSSVERVPSPPTGIMTE